MVLEKINNYENFGDTEITFYYRSIIDWYGYSKLERIPVSELLLAKCGELDYCRKVFISLLWEEIYEKAARGKLAAINML
ncbi:hypothetical protein PSOS111911_03775 [Pseudoalteromonas ostreae]